MSMYLCKYTPHNSKHISHMHLQIWPQRRFWATTSRATAAVAAQWWLSSSAAWQNWQTVGKVFRFNPDPSFFGQNWPAFFIHAPKKHNLVNKIAQHLLTNWKSKDTDATLSSALSNQMRAMTRIPPAIASKTASWDLITKYDGIEDIHHRTCGQWKKPNIYSVDSTICLWSICEDSSQGLTTHRDPWQSQHDRIWCKSIWNMPPRRSQRLILLWRLLPVSAENVINS